MKLLLGLTLFVTCIAFSVAAHVARRECQVIGIYSSVGAERGTRGLTRSGDLVEIEKILVPASINSGTYDVRVRRMAKDLYRIENKDLYIHTQYCYEYVHGESAILKITESYGLSKGLLIFN